MKPKRNYLKTILFCACAPVAAQAADIDVIGDPAYSVPSFPSADGGVDGGLGANVRIINGTNVTWTKNNTYFITDKLFIPKGATLTIEPGTKIYGSIDDNNGSTDKTTHKVGALTACRGGKLIADGTAAEPIIFSSVKEWESIHGVDSPFDVGTGISTAADVGPEDAGQWGGVILLGQAYVSFVTNTGANTGTVQIEGFAPSGSGTYDGDTIPDATQYGVSTNFPLNNADNSGIVRYVSIRHGGYEFASAKEINGLTLGGVGSGTTISHVEVYANQDDGIEFFGGRVNTDHIVMAFNQDDSFDIDEAWNGTNQFWFSIQNPGIADAGGEWDGVGGNSTGYNLGDTVANHANPKIYNATIIGAGTSNTLSQLPNVTGEVNWEKGNHGMHIEDYFAGEIYNSVFDDFSGVLVKYNDNAASYGVNFKFKHNTIGRFGDSPQPQIETSTVSFTTGSAAVGGGTLNVTLTGTGITGSPITFPITITNGQSSSSIATAIRNAISANTNVTNLYYVNVGGSSSATVLTAKTPGAAANIGNLAINIPANTFNLKSGNSSDTQVGIDAPTTPGDNGSYVLGTAPADVIFDSFEEPVDGNSNGGVNPQYTTYTRDANGFLTSINPSPATGSPLIGSGVSLAGGAPVAVTYRGAFAPGANSNWAAGWTKLSTSGALLGAAPLPENGGEPPFADVDNDGVSDTLEVTPELVALGFVVGNDDTALFASIYDTDSILDLRTVGQVTVQKDGSNNVTLSVPVEKSTGLDSWGPAGSMQLGPFTGDPTKEFYRLKVEGAE